MDKLGSISKWKINLADLIFIGDILNYEGPMLSLFVDQNKCPYLFRWVKQDEDSHKWQIFKVLPGKLSAYFNHEISERELVLAAIDNEYLLVNIDPQLNYQHIHFLLQEQLPADYLPGKNAYFREEWCPDLDAIYGYLKSVKIYAPARFEADLVAAEPSVTYHIHSRNNQSDLSE